MKMKAEMLKFLVNLVGVLCLPNALFAQIVGLGMSEAFGKSWCLVKTFPQKSFPKTVPPGNYSGITHLHDDIYAVVSDKSDSALYYNFRIQVNPETGELLNVVNLGYEVMVDGTAYDGRVWKGKDGNFDHEAIAKVSDSTLVVASEGKFRLKEYSITPSEVEKQQQGEHQWEMSWPSSLFASNYAFESLAFDSVRHCLWTISESVLKKDGVPATPQNHLANSLRLIQIGRNDQIRSYAYQMDRPTTGRNAETYVMGVSELCTLPDGQLLVLEREAFIPKIKLGAFCKCKLFRVNIDSEEIFSMRQPFGLSTPFVKKSLVAEWKTGLSMFDHSFANYEGMCMGPQLKDGSWVVILLSDSQNQYAGVLKDWFKTIVIR